MAFLMNPSGTASAVRKPSVADAMLMLNPRNTPFLSTLKKGRKPRAFIEQWPVRTALAAVTTSVADGKDVSTTDATDVESKKKVLGNRPHQLERVAFTGNLTNELEHQYGIQNIHADTVIQFMEALKWDTEVTLLGQQESGISTVTHSTRGVSAWLGLATGATAIYTGYTIDTANLIDASVRSVTGANVLLGTTDAAASVVTETNLRNLLQSIFIASFAPLPNALGICTPAMKSAITNFSIGATVTNTGADHTVPVRRWDGQDSKTVGANVTRVEADFGSIDLVPHVGLPTGTTTTQIYPYLLVLDRDVWSLLPVQPIHMRNLPDLGGGPRTLMRTSFMLKCESPMRNGSVFWKAA